MSIEFRLLEMSGAESVWLLHTSNKHFPFSDSDPTLLLLPTPVDVDTAVLRFDRNNPSLARYLLSTY